MNAPHIEYNKKVYDHKLEIQQILGILAAPISLHSEAVGMGGRVPHLTPADTAAASLPDIGTPLAPSQLILYS